MINDNRMALCDVRGPLNDLMEKLAGEEGSSVWLPGLKMFLRKEHPWEQEKPPFPLLPRPVEVYPTPFIPGLPWKERIDRCKFDDVDPDVWKYIDSFVDVEDEDPSPLSIELDGFGRVVSSDGVESCQTQNNKGMISTARFLHLCEVHPDLQRKNPIVCTKEICVGRVGGVRVLYAYGHAGERRLCLLLRDDVWVGYCRFPSSRKVSSALGAGKLGT